MKKYYPGNIVDCKVVGIKPYGVFVKIDDDMNGLIHISEISDNYVADIYKIVSVGETIKAKILDVDYSDNRAKLSLKAMRKRPRYRTKKTSFGDEQIDVDGEFFSLKVRLDDFVEDAEKRLNND